jgi:hypothetical protein
MSGELLGFLVIYFMRFHRVQARPVAAFLSNRNRSHCQIRICFNVLAQDLAVAKSHTEGEVPRMGPVNETKVPEVPYQPKLQPPVGKRPI